MVTLHNGFMNSYNPTSAGIALVNGTAVFPNALMPDAAVLLEDGRISALGPRKEMTVPEGFRRVDMEGGYLVPGFVDIHVHGGGGADFMDGSVEAVERGMKAHLRHGTTSIFPTTTTGRADQIQAMLDACSEVKTRTATRDALPTLWGIHLYGPYFAEEKVGCHSRLGRRDPDPEEYLAYLESGLVKVATCAAELAGAEEFYGKATAHGCLVTCGHSNASWTEMKRAYECGMRHVDHFWCAMSSVPSLRAKFGAPYQGSMEQFVLAHEEMSTEVIADGCHLAPELLEFARVMIGADRLCLVTDASRALDMPPGNYRFGPEEDGEWFQSDGNVGFIPGGGLASSAAGMDRMVRNMHLNGGASLVDAVKMATLTPARRAGIAKETGSLEFGKRGDVLVLNRDLEVIRVFVGGMEAFAKGA